MDRAVLVDSRGYTTLCEATNEGMMRECARLGLSAPVTVHHWRLHTAANVHDYFTKPYAEWRKVQEYEWSWQRGY